MLKSNSKMSLSSRLDFFIPKVHKFFSHEFMFTVIQSNAEVISKFFSEIKNLRYIFWFFIVS
jgi:hypothetical protein